MEVLILAMPIFDEIGKKISNSTQSALKGTKDMADISRLNTVIADEQKLLHSYYMQIGKKYYDLFSGAPSEEFSALCASIAETEERITNIKIEIQEIRGLKKCRSCGAENHISASFCATCGHDTRNDPLLYEEQPEQQKKCPNCDSVVDDNMSFCTGCGNKL